MQLWCPKHEGKDHNNPYIKDDGVLPRSHWQDIKGTMAYELGQGSILCLLVFAGPS